MYPFQFPKRISSPFGHEMTFQRLDELEGAKKLIITNKVSPGAGPPFHTHFKQDEGLTVKKGRLGYQIKGKEEKFLEEGESAVFHRGVCHRFWNAGKETMECEGWVMPANSLDYFLAGIYASMTKAGSPKGDLFDTAFLITHYKSEYDIEVIPVFVKKIVMPVVVFVGKLLSKYDHFEDIPEAAIE